MNMGLKITISNSARQLLPWKQYLNSNELLLDHVLDDMKHLLSLNSFNISKIPIKLVIDKVNADEEIDAWFSWTPKNRYIVVEIPKNLKMSNNKFYLSVLTHEFFHLMLRKNKALFSEIEKISKNNKLIKKLADGMPNKMFFEELFISSFIPEGYLSEKYFDIKIKKFSKKPKDIIDWRKFVAYKMRNISKEYLEKRKKIDKEYLNEVMSILKNYK